MMRINLLPPEILERRKAERRFSWVILAAIVIAVVLAGVWAIAYFQLQGKQDELAAIQQQVQATNAQAEKLAIFEERAAELETRRTTANLALADRRDWAKLFNELSLVLPADIWIANMSAAQEGGLNLSGYAIDAPSDSPDQGHKSIAKMLIRLADLDQLTNVWLTSSAKGEFEEQPVLEFSVTADVAAPAPEGGAQ